MTSLVLVGLLTIMPLCTPNTKWFSNYRYWPYLEKMAEKLPELQPLTVIKPFLSVMHAKAHTGKCEVQCTS